MSDGRGPLTASEICWERYFDGLHLDARVRALTDDEHWALGARLSNFEMGVMGDDVLIWLMREYRISAAAAHDRLLVMNHQGYIKLRSSTDTRRIRSPYSEKQIKVLDAIVGHRTVEAQGWKRQAREEWGAARGLVQAFGVGTPTRLFQPYRRTRESFTPLRFPGDDHCSMWRRREDKRGCITAWVSQPYITAFEGNVETQARATAASLGLTLRIAWHESWWYPGRTILLEWTRQEGVV